MKRLLALACVLVMSLSSITAYASTDVIDYEFGANDSTGALAEIKTNWTVHRQERVLIEGDYLSVGHSNVNGKCGFTKAVSGVGLKYTYELKSKSHGNRYIDASNITSGEYWSSKTTIGNGFYRLEFSLENGGIWAVNKNGVWTKIYTGEIYTDTATDFSLYKVEVEGNTAKIYKDGTELATYELPADTQNTSYEFTSKSVLYQDNAITHIKSIKLTDTSDTLSYNYTGIYIGETVVTDAIPQATEKLTIGLSLPVIGATVTSELKENGTLISSTADVENGEIVVSADFSYDKNYTLKVNVQGISVSGLPETISFRTAKDLFETEAVINNSTPATTTAAVTVKNFSGEAGGAVAMIFAYDATNNVLDWDYIEIPSIANMQTSTSVNTPGIDATGADKIVVMIVDSIINIRPLAKAETLEVQ